MKRDPEEYFIKVGIILTACAILCAFVLIILSLLGCTPHVAPIDLSAERVDQTPQRVQDLQWPCERCGDVATENVSEVADEQNWRCDKCKPRDVMPRLQRKPKLERQWVMR